MGIWGIGVFENDIAADIQDTFEKDITCGILPSIAMQNLLATFADELSDAQDGPLGYRALFVLAKRANLLTDRLYAEAQMILQTGTARSWPTRQKRLQKILSAKNMSDMATYAVGRLKKVTKSWEVGDTFALPLDVNLCLNYGIEKANLVFRVIKETEYSHLFGTLLAHAKIVKGDDLPLTVTEYDNLEYIQMDAVEYENRFRPFASEDVLPQEFRQNYRPDPWGYLPVFDFELMESQGNYPPTNLLYLGNFPNVTAPVYSFRPYKSYPGCAWNYAEEYCLKRYYLYNLRKATFYKGNI